MRSFSVALLSCLLSLLAALAPGVAEGCTGFFLGGEDGRLMAISYDWKVPGGRLVVNTMGLEKTAMVPSDATPAAWKSKFGSVTFNQYGREFPIGGFNQMGLAIHALWLDGTSYPEDAGPAIDALQWIQYCLDNHVSVRRVVESAQSMTIQSPAPLHFFACDRSGSCAVIEFLDGTPAIRALDELPLPVLTNSTYAASIGALDRSLGYGGKVAPGDEDNESLDRFVTTATALHTRRPGDPADPVDRAFAILERVASESDNQWRIVYDLRENVVHFATREKPERSRLAIEELDYHCVDGGTRTLDLAQKPPGDVSAAMVPYSTQDNITLIKSSVAKTDFLQPMAESRLLEAGRYPDTLRCTLPARPPTPTPGPGGRTLVTN
jgi:choloylglycine hydrolase